MKNNFNKIVIVGVGLIGGSIGLKLKAKKCDAEIIGIDIENDLLDRARELGAIDHGTLSFAEGLVDADLLILATPVGSMRALVSAALPYLPINCIITDVGSSKVEINQIMEELLPEEMVFVGGHPMAGSEKAGIQAARDNLLHDAIYIFTPGVRTTPEALEQLKQFSMMLGAKPLVLSPQEHDDMVATISHLPHLMAASLVNTVTHMGHEEALSLAAGGFKDTTRIAGSQPDMWVDICFANRDAIIAGLDKLSDEIEMLKDLLYAGKRVEFREKLAKAKELRDKIS